MVISQKLLNPGEEILVSTRTHAKVLILPIITLALLLAAGVLFQIKIDNGTAQLVVWGVIGVLILWRVVGPFLVWLTASYTITNRRLITRHGVITRRGHDIPLGRISDVAYERDLIDRVLGCGTLVVSDASTNGQVLIYDIPRVEETQRELNQLLHRLHGGETRTHEGH
ncbi:PH domain-containing protein [Nocardioides sp. R-C-SC26]|uniref:PH domain-containing protein n=1 Tax=Nocardioides sp. R-C-SC26 TaxID=2870414 RepID=UPI001E322B60|nr:PH domain-containing protein [Nocardioides sp. R-C-SC26]